MQLEISYTYYYKSEHNCENKHLYGYLCIFNFYMIDYNCKHKYMSSYIGVYIQLYKYIYLFILIRVIDNV